MHQVYQLHAYVIVLLSLLIQITLQVKVVLLKRNKLDFKLLLIIERFSKFVLELLDCFGCSFLFQVELQHVILLMQKFGVDVILAI